jgi:hypothetical protein
LTAHRFSGKTYTHLTRAKTSALFAATLLLTFTGALVQPAISQQSKSDTPSQNSTHSDAGATSNGAPTLTSTEKIAVQSLMSEAAKITEALNVLHTNFENVAADMAKSHPGYHLSDKTLRLEKDVKVEKSTK